MLFLLVLTLLSKITAEELVENIPPSLPPNCNCSRILQGEEVTDPPPPFPMTSFTCWGRYDGYYADIEVDCTIFHYCQTWYYPTGLNETVKWDFACPQSTIFNQKILSCTPPNISFDCQESPNYYWVNYNFTSTSTSATPTPSLEYSTPHSNIGQQLIVGGLGPQSATIQESTDLVTASEQTSGDSYSEQPPNVSYSKQTPSYPHSEQSSNVADSKQTPSHPHSEKSSTSHSSLAEPPEAEPQLGFEQPPSDHENISDIITFTK